MRIPKSLDDNLIFQLGTVARKVHQHVENVFRNESLDITPEQFSLLTILWYNEGISIKELADRSQRDKTTISRVVSNMIKHDLIRRLDNVDDKRAKRIFLTDKGRNLQDQLVMLSGEIYVQALGNLSDEELDRTLEVFQKIENNLSDNSES
ncbi:MarR family winged helix-turn-helix transcriptional regulator [Prolixibacter denitrificans]|uniref:Transcriptional regulator n=1 Tax=Prolixibacter denitrificans TaxID=1541063 RepID=A0A2P8C751_9BACT|nr:MarR family transcriptional regulator [Prolixibacter denitrificans]PSK80757.1 DNA-binding MarR family transcriptional regulator [Prolixibacter denitrificans]GET22444.1 transcriptional regulator [Prolixibacter denitrificans]